MGNVEQLAENHWNYIDGVLKHDGVSLKDRWVIGWHYKMAFKHGYGHGMEVKNDIKTTTRGN